MKKCSSCQQLKLESEFYSKGKASEPIRYAKNASMTIAKTGGKCSRCGYNDHYVAMQFHHVSNKDYTWNKLRLLNWERTKAELDKCELLCANCHAIIHSLNP